MKNALQLIRGVFLRSLTALEQTRPDMDIMDAEYVVFDTELTGLEMASDSIVSIGAFSMTGTRIHAGQGFYRMVSPRTAIRGASVCVHGITPDEAGRCPGIGDVLPEFLEFCGNRVLVGHFVSIDIGFINEEMRRLYGGVLENAALDTFRLHRRFGPQNTEQCAYYDSCNDDASLMSLAGHYGIPAAGAHDAQVDAFVTAQVFQRMLVLARQRGVRTVRELIKAGSPV